MSTVVIILFVLICYSTILRIANRNVRKKIYIALKHISDCCGKATNELQYILKNIKKCVSVESTKKNTKDIKKLEKELENNSFEESQKTLETVFKRLDVYAVKIAKNQYISGFNNKNQSEIISTLISKEEVEKISNIHNVYLYVKKITEGR